MWRVGDGDERRCLHILLHPRGLTLKESEQGASSHGAAARAARLQRRLLALGAAAAPPPPAASGCSARRQLDVSTQPSGGMKLRDSASRQGGGSPLAATLPSSDCLAPHTCVSESRFSFIVIVSLVVRYCVLGGEGGEGGEAVVKAGEFWLRRAEGTPRAPSFNERV